MPKPAIMWEANPAAFGAFNGRIDGKGRSVAGVSNNGASVKGFLLGREIYQSDVCDKEKESEAMDAVQCSFECLLSEWPNLPLFLNPL